MNNCAWLCSIGTKESKVAVKRKALVQVNRPPLVALLRCCVVALLRCCVVALLRCCVVALLRCCVVALLRCCVVALLRCCVVALLRCCVVALLRCCVVALLRCCVVALLRCVLFFIGLIRVFLDCQVFFSVSQKVKTSSMNHSFRHLSTPKKRKKMETFFFWLGLEFLRMETSRCAKEPSFLARVQWRLIRDLRPVWAVTCRRRILCFLDFLCCVRSHF